MPKVFRVETTTLKVDDSEKTLYLVTTPDPKVGVFATTSTDELIAFIS